MNGYGDFNLSSLPGAQVRNIDLGRMGKRNCICIPLDFCGAYVSDWQNIDRARVSICVSLREFGTPTQNGATHGISLYYNKKHKKIEAQFLEAAKATVRKEQPNLTEDDITKAAWNRVRPTLAFIKDSAADAPSADASTPVLPPDFQFAQPAGTQPVVPMMPAPEQAGAPMMPPPGEAKTDDLPF